MANTTISDLTAGSITDDNDCFVMDTSEGTTVKITYAELVDALENIFQNKLVFDTLPNSFSNNPVASYGIYNALGYQSQLVWDSTPSSSNHAITSGAVYNAIGGVSGLTFLQAYDSSVSQCSAGFVFTPQGAYSMYSNIMGTIPSVASSVAGQIISSALPTVVTKVLPSQTTDFTIAVSDWVDGQATVTGTFNVGTGYLNDVVPTMGERATWNSCGVYPTAITATGVTFECATTPTVPLTFKVTQTAVSDPAAST